jgi:hypothetical protein
MHYAIERIISTMLTVIRPDVTWRRGDGEMITVKTAGKKIKSKLLIY